jgi:cell fate regulator YaaT (PSP1 superfamily)
MAGSITLPQIVLDLEEEDRKQYEALKPPKTIVVRYGYLKMVAELPYDGDAVPGCGSKIVIRTARGTELAEMLTTTCSNSGCGKSVSRKEMLTYIDNSGGRDYPFSTQGRALRTATPEDMTTQTKLDSQQMPMIRFTKNLISEMALPMKLVDIEFLLGGERVIFHFASETRVDFRELVKRLATEYSTRIEMNQVNARDEARITADYEKCGQQCCCKQFLKVLKPVSIRSAKVQKATLDPTKISGRCGRLMCCLRYEDETYESLRKRLPKRNTVVETEEGQGVVLDSQILTQLVLVKLDKQDAPQAFPMENIKIVATPQQIQQQEHQAQRAAKQAAIQQQSEEGDEMSDGPEMGDEVAPGMPGAIGTQAPRAPQAPQGAQAPQAPRGGPQQQNDSRRDGGRQGGDNRQRDQRQGDQRQEGRRDDRRGGQPGGQPGGAPQQGQPRNDGGRPPRNNNDRGPRTDGQPQQRDGQPRDANQQQNRGQRPPQQPRQGGQQGGQNQGGNRPSYEPLRPRPGAPLNENQVESAEGKFTGGAVPTPPPASAIPPVSPTAPAQPPPVPPAIDQSKPPTPTAPPSV